MDSKIQELERAYKSHPDDPYLRRQLIAAWSRVGRLYDARQLLGRRMATRDFDVEELKKFVELGHQAGFISSLDHKPCDLIHFSALFHARGKTPMDVEIEIGFAGVQNSGAFVSVFALADFFGVPLMGLTGSGIEGPLSHAPLSEQHGFSQGFGAGAHVSARVPFSETSHEFRLELRSPWIVSRRFRVRAVRVTTLPSSPGKVMLRRKILRSINALAFVVDSRNDGSGETNESLFRRLDKDFQENWTVPLNAFRVATQYLEPTRPRLHRALALALGLTHNSRVHANIETNAPPAERPQAIFSNFHPGKDRVLSHEGLLDTFSLLVYQTIRDLERV